MRYRNRSEAGARLAELLEGYAGRGDVVVLGLARGGIVVAAEVARRLDAPLDVMLVRKLGAPGNPELAIGAVAEGGEPLVNRTFVHYLEVPEEYLEREIERQVEILERRSEIYRRGRNMLPLRNRIVILVDDGLATGSTAEASVAAAGEHGPRKIVFAAPVASRQGLERLRESADEVVCPLVPEDLQAVGYYYEDFNPVTDEDVIRILKEFSGPGG